MYIIFEFLFRKTVRCTVDEKSRKLRCRPDRIRVKFLKFVYDTSSKRSSKTSDHVKT